MLIREFIEDPDALKLAAIGQFLLKRAQDTDAVKPMSVDAFINLARENGINMTADRLEVLAVQPPLKNIIDSIQNGEIVWKGSQAPTQPGAPTMSVDQARKTVNQMAKRAIDLK
jgi:hypothetical protein